MHFPLADNAKKIPADLRVVAVWVLDRSLLMLWMMASSWRQTQDVKQSSFTNIGTASFNFTSLLLIAVVVHVLADNHAILQSSILF